MGNHRRQGGFSLLEVVVVVAIAGAITAIAMPSMSAWRTRSETRSSARAMADVLTSARNNAIRTGTQHIVYMRIPGVGTTDPNGTDIVDEAAQPVEAITLQDDDGDCHIDAGEPQAYLSMSAGMTYGLTSTALKAPSDTSNPTTATGVTFADPENTANPIRWLMFRPDGIPVAFSGDFTGCDTIGSTGSGGGAIYMTDGTNDFAAVMMPLGGVRLHSFDRAANGWTF